MKSSKLVLLSLLLIVFYSYSINAQDSRDVLLKGFITPPVSSKPRVWWHWMNGNITKDGISKDLLWMNRIGIGGFMNFDASLGTPQIVKKRLTYMTPDWKDAFQFTTKLADSLHLEMAIAGSPGWSESGGPWVSPPDGMKKIVWSVTKIEGDKPFTGKLQKPPSVTGAFQNLPMATGMSFSPAATPPEYYMDIAVVAYKVSESDVSFGREKPTVTASGGNFTLQQLTDGDIATTNMLPADNVKGYAWIQFTYENPQTIKAITIVGGGDKGPFGLYGELNDTRNLQISNDGEHFTNICSIPAGSLVEQTITIPATTSKYFRITFKNPPPMPNFGAMFGGNSEAPKPPAGTDIAEIFLHPSTRINRLEEKAGFGLSTDLYAQETPESGDAIHESDVIDLTSKMKSDGILDWTPPGGTWNILCFGYSLTGKQNAPASPEATGLEVDKLDPKAVKTYFENYLGQYKNATNGLMGSKGGLQFIITDSWEAGSENWTSNMPEEFSKRRGYSIIPWLPVLTGQIVKSSEQSEKFLWDFRKTLSELVAEYHYDQLTTLLHQNGMKRYSESHESGRALMADGMEVKRTADIPMSAMWTPNKTGDESTGYKADIRESASVSHIYGQNFVAAESLTAIGNAWAFSPERLKPTADLELACGLNRFVIHTSVHQPVDDKIPGLGLGPFGQWFTRHETWAEQAKPWIDYLSRSSFMLQQGKFVADIVYYYGEDNNITSLFGNKLPDIPHGYNYDFVNADALLNVLSVKDDQIVTKGGMSYGLLVLDSNSRYMSLPVLRKIHKMVEDGAVVLGPKPIGSPSLSDDQGEFKKIADQLWTISKGENKFGKGRVFSDITLAEALVVLQIKPDFEHSNLKGDPNIMSVHRRLPDTDIFWVDNRRDSLINLEAIFRVDGKAAEIWHPETGKTELVSYNISDGRTKVSLLLEPYDAVFVVFSKKTNDASFVMSQKTENKLTSLSGEWLVKFQLNRGAPAEANFNTLTSWSNNTDAGIKYFSGTGNYFKTILAPDNWFKTGNHLWIDLGDVKNLAEILVNGKSLGIVWRKPYRIDVTDALKAGSNNLEIRVTNLWVNRLIGDQQPGTKTKLTYTTQAFYQANSPLLSSGLLGPVQIVSISTK
jgi:alpha-L-rhamnosidase/F5/8 type C domain